MTEPRSAWSRCGYRRRRRVSRSCTRRASRRISSRSSARIRRAFTALAARRWTWSWRRAMVTPNCACARGEARAYATRCSSLAPRWPRQRERRSRRWSSRRLSLRTRRRCTRNSRARAWVDTRSSSIIASGRTSSRGRLGNTLYGFVAATPLAKASDMARVDPRHNPDA